MEGLDHPHVCGGRSCNAKPANLGYAGVTLNSPYTKVTWHGRCQHKCHWQFQLNRNYGSTFNLSNEIGNGIDATPANDPLWQMDLGAAVGNLRGLRPDDLALL